MTPDTVSIAVTFFDDRSAARKGEEVTALDSLAALYPGDHRPTKDQLPCGRGAASPWLTLVPD